MIDLKSFQGLRKRVSGGSLFLDAMFVYLFHLVSINEYAPNLVPRARAHLRSAGSKCILGADQKECSLWERDWVCAQKTEGLNCHAQTNPGSLALKSSRSAGHQFKPEGVVMGSRLMVDQ